MKISSILISLLLLTVTLGCSNAPLQVGDKCTFTQLNGTKIRTFRGEQGAYRSYVSKLNCSGHYLVSREPNTSFETARQHRDIVNITVANTKIHLDRYGRQRPEATIKFEISSNSGKSEKIIADVRASLRIPVGKSTRLVRYGFE